MPRLSALIAKVVTVHGERHPELHAIAACYEEARADLEPHMLKEEQVLFPMIRELASASIAAVVPVRVVAESDLGDAPRARQPSARLLAELRRLTNGYQAPG